MIMFTEAELLKMKKAQVVEIAELYIKATGDKPEETLKTVEDYIMYIKTAKAATKGYPHLVTEEDTELLETGEVKVGDVIIVPEPTQEEEVREGMLADAALCLEDLTDEERAAKLTELSGLETTALGDEVRKLQAGKGLPQPPVVQTPRAERAKQEKADKPKSQEPTGDAAVADPANLLTRAIESGLLRYENQLIVSFATKIQFGRVRYELRAANGTAYIVEAKDIVELTK